jgi:hypothetical protein
MGKTDDISKELETVDLDDTNSDDYFEQVLKSTNEATDEDDASSGASDKNAADSSDDGDDKSGKENGVTIESLQAKLKEAEERADKLEKESKGRLNDTVKSRRERSEMKAELNDLKTAVSTLLEKRVANDKDALEDDDKDPLKETRTEVAFDEDDKAFVDLSKVNEKIEAENAKTREELQALKNAKLEEDLKLEFKNNVDSVVAEEETFAPAMDVLQTAFEDLNNAVIKMQERLEIMDGDDGALDQDKALDLLHGSDELAEFAEKHPGIDPIKIARAFNTKMDLRSSLQDIVNVKELAKKNDDDTDDVAKLDDKIQSAKNKPGSLTNTENQAGGNSDLISRIAQLDSADILDMSDAEVAKIEAMLEKEA